MLVGVWEHETRVVFSMTLFLLRGEFMGIDRFRNALQVAVFVVSILLVNVAGAEQQAPTVVIEKIHVTESESPVFSAEEMKAFVAAATKADEIKDPMKRCLNYPDPPGSHWSRDGLLSYCRYIVLRTVSPDEVRRLVQAGQAKELDQRLSALDSDPKGHPSAFYGFLIDLPSGDATWQATIESWKQQSPKSAYAYTASGWDYTSIGWDARGAKWAADTPQSNFDAMENAMERARGDIEMAGRLNSRLSAPYAGMINIATAVSDKGYALDAAKRGLQLARDKYPILVELAKYTSSRWYGNEKSRQWLLSQVDQYASDEPLLHVVRAIVLSFEANIDYDAPADGEWKVCRQALDDVATRGLLRGVGKAALMHGQYAVAYVYLSEVARFNPADQESADRRAQAAAMMGAAGSD